jgi:hypothetical protein
LANLTKYKKINKQQHDALGLSEEFGSTDDNGVSSSDNFTLHIAEDFNVLVLVADMVFPESEVELLRRIKFDISSFTMGVSADSHNL